MQRSNPVSSLAMLSAPGLWVQNKMGKQAIIETVDLKKIYGMGDATVAALNGVNIQITAGEFVSIICPSGFGKSALMHILGFLSRPQPRQYILHCQDNSNPHNKQLARHPIK